MREQIYDEKIAPLMRQIIQICSEHDIGVFASFDIHKDAGDDNLACTTYIEHDSTADNFRRRYEPIAAGALETEVPHHKRS